jgi:hypothetical protein
MDSKVLSKEQLQQLVKFINSRGFKGEILVLEILDHFACKVEEILAANLNMPFDMAMKKAHESFGVRGFYPIADAVMQQTKSKYKKIFWTNFKQVMAKPVSLIALPIIGFSVYNLYIWTSSHLPFKIWDTWNIVDITFLTLLILCPLLDVFIMYSLPKSDRKHPFIAASLMNGSASGLTFYILSTNILRGQNAEYPWIIGAVLALYIMYVIPRHIATRKTIAKAQNDLAAVRQMAL